MDLREEDERYFGGQASRVCASVLTALAVLGSGVALAAIVGCIAGGGVIAAVVFVFTVLATAAFLWGMATLLRSQRQIEENTRQAAKLLERMTGPAKPGSAQSE